MNEYTVISIDDSRKDKSDWIKQRFIRWTYADINFVNGSDRQQLAAAQKYWSSVETPGPFKAGEFGIFYSVLNCLEYGANNNGILYFEDDAIPVSGFEYDLETHLAKLPVDMDLFACWSPENQQGDYDGVSRYNELGEPLYEHHQGSIFDIGNANLCKMWQGYGNVCMYFSRRGCIKLLHYIMSKGFFSPIDCLICIAAHTGYLNAYALKPGAHKLIDHDWNSPTTIHTSAWGDIKELI